MTKVLSYKKIGKKNTYHIRMRSKYHNYVINGVVSKNCHSYAYSAVSYVTAYLKANYPLQYMTSLLNANSDNLDKLTPYIDECYKLGINVLPPDINKSSNVFEHDIENNAILFGFNGIKGVGESSITPIIKERENGKFTSLKDLLNRIPSLNKTTIENLIKCGALNSIEKYPHKYLMMLEFSAKAKQKAEYKKGNISFYDSMVKCFVENIVKSKSKEYISLLEKNKDLKSPKDKDKKAENKKIMENIVLSNIKSFEDSKFIPKVQDIRANETNIMGYSISHNPKKEIIELSDYINNTSIQEMLDKKDYYNLFGFMGRVKTIKKTKNGSYMLFLTDDTTDISTFISRESFLELEDKLSVSTNYFRIIGKINKSFNPEKYSDNFKLESIRYFNTSKDTNITLRTESEMPLILQALEEIRENNTNCSDDINYRLSVMTKDNNVLKTKIDYWINDLSSIAEVMIKYEFTKV